ncbi:MAG: glutaredoxin 3 [Rhodobacteraceae bacterium]|nr:glutaredoxin 3 [Paracoccaceae bacterium]
MKTVEIYTTPSCPYCIAAKRLLDGKGVAYTEIDVSRDMAKRQEMRTRAQGRYTVPQIFIDGAYVGDCDHIHLLDHRKQLDDLLAD